MTKFAEFPLRPHGQPWPGLKDSSSRLMRQGGEMSDCTNVIINTSDVLEKRKGFVRAFDERFGGVICGLFKYTDEYGREHVIIADETGFSVREPYALPLFTQSDAYPFDDFNLENGSDLDAEKWRNASRYKTSSWQMRLRAGASTGVLASDMVANSARWFKDQLSRSYQVRIQYDFNGTGPEQAMSIAIKGGPGLAGAVILGVIRKSATGVRTMDLARRTEGGVWIPIDSADLDGADEGFFTVQYNQATRVAVARVVASGGSLVTLSSPPLTVIEDLDLGQSCGIAIGYDGSMTVPGCGIKAVDGGPI